MSDNTDQPHYEDHEDTSGPVITTAILRPSDHVDGPTADFIWKTLKKINVSEHTEKKGPRKLTYLSWTWAYSTMMDNFPSFRFRFDANEVHPDSTVTVHVACTIGNVTQTMWLPVMDNASKVMASQMSPTSRDISDTKMRCLVKCMALFGLGLYIFAGEDLPEDETTPKAAVKSVPKKVDMKVTQKLEAAALVLHAWIEECDNGESLKKFWMDNKTALKEMEQNATGVFEKVLEGFKAKSKELAAASKE
jgi:hypothetical protein